jgi:hypothetical protein
MMCPALPLISGEAMLDGLGVTSPKLRQNVSYNHQILTLLAQNDAPTSFYCSFACAVDDKH